ncbi:MAG TPA: alpha-1,2-fucosyltransferase [Lutibacter sp.]
MKVIVSGGLGNQMFQYALYLALKNIGKKVKLDTSLYSFTKMHNGCELEKCFGINNRKINNSKWHLLKLRAVLKYKPKSIVYSDLLYFDRDVFKTSCKYVNGNWQSQKYFMQIEKKIRDAFVFKNIDDENKKIAVEMVDSISIAIHIRRGDYLGNSIYSGACNEDYYTKAIKAILNKINPCVNIMFYVFSDDKEFSGKFIENFKIPAKLININNSEDSYKDMYLMSQCKHNIIANSSFSWWGAWLNNNPEKIVVAPQKWFGKGSEENYRDIVPNNWIKL